MSLKFPKQQAAGPSPAGVTDDKATDAVCSGPQLAVPIPRPRQIARFWARVDKSSHPKGCWIWRGNIRDGYGRCWFADSDQQAHRVSYWLTKGAIPAGLLLLHSCDNPPCCNPDHLTPGTIADNNADMKSKSRHIHGEHSPLARLRSDQVFAIRVLFAAGEATRYELAERFGVSHRQICYIVKNKRWKTE